MTVNKWPGNSLDHVVGYQQEGTWDLSDVFSHDRGDTFYANAGKRQHGGCYQQRGEKEYGLI
jgi:hypothetical protein